MRSLRTNCCPSVFSLCGLLSVTLLWHLLPTLAAQDVRISGSVLARSGNLELMGDFDAGFGHVAVEVKHGDSPWTTLLSSALDGRAGRVSARLPMATLGTSLIARFHCGPAPVPTPMVNDPALLTISYGDIQDVPYETRMANFDSLLQLYNSLLSQTRESRNATLIEHARMLPGIVEAGESPFGKNVYFVYSNGIQSAIVDNMPPEPSVPSGVAQAPVSQLISAPTAVPRVDPSDPDPLDNAISGRFPQSKTALVVFGHSLEGGFSDVTVGVRHMLQKAGYEATRVSNFTIAEAKSWRDKNLGAFFLSTHGAGTKVQAILSTSEPITSERSAQYDQMLKDGELVETSLRNWQAPALPDIRVYGITTEFFRNHLQGMFAPHSISILHACSGGRDTFAEDFFMVGSGGHIGWDKITYSSSGIRMSQLIDRLSGANLYDPRSIPIAERPFPMRETLYWMEQHGLTNEPLSDSLLAKLVYTPHPTKPFYALRPSVHHLFVDASNSAFDHSVLRLDGSVGDDPGPGRRKVMWGDRELTVLSWEAPELVDLKLPDAPYPLGDIKIEIDGLTSNAIPITEWSLPITHILRSGSGGLQININTTLKLRGDVHRGRLLPQDDQWFDPRVELALFDDSVGSWLASGTSEETTSGGDTIITTWSGSGNLRSYYDEPADAQDVVRANVTVDVSTGKVLFANYTVSGGNFRETVVRRTRPPTVRETTTITEKPVLLVATAMTSSGTLDAATGRLSVGAVPVMFSILGVPQTVENVIWPSAVGANSPSAETPR